ncbi:MAG: PIN domain-containing protein [Mycobacteriaceae bacterium]
MADVIVDTSALLAYFDASEPDHVAVTETIGATTDLLVISPYAVAELDYLVASRHGVDAELAVLDELTAGAWELAGFGADELKKAQSIITNYHDQQIGVADASNVVLAERYRTRTIVTLDRQHFDVLRSTGGDRFTVLPRPR